MVSCDTIKSCCSHTKASPGIRLEGLEQLTAKKPTARKNASNMLVDAMRITETPTESPVVLADLLLKEGFR